MTTKNYRRNRYGDGRKQLTPLVVPDFVLARKADGEAERLSKGERALDAALGVPAAPQPAAAPTADASSNQYESVRVEDSPEWKRQHNCELVYTGRWDAGSPIMEAIPMTAEPESVTDVLTDMLQRAWMKRGFENAVDHAFRYGASVRLYVDTDGLLHFMIYQRDTYPGIFEWQSFLRSLPPQARPPEPYPQPELYTHNKALNKKYCLTGAWQVYPNALQ